MSQEPNKARQVARGIFIFDLLSSNVSEAGLRDIGICFIFLKHVWGGCEGYSELFYCPQTCLVSGIFIFVLYSSNVSEVAVRNIYIQFKLLKNKKTTS